MCGIAGIYGSKAFGEVAAPMLTHMQERLRHRGPDDYGTYVDSSHQIALAHTRLAILDLSSAGHQPMEIDSGRFCIVFNGEIYNFRELKKQLEDEGEQFFSDSDTEVILRLYKRRGVGCLGLLKGMFAFAIWDREAEKLFLARDPLGIKPLFIWRSGDTVAFASELRALTSAGLANVELCPQALTEYFLLGSVQEPATLIRGITSLPAGSWVSFCGSHVESGNYFDLKIPSEHESLAAVSSYSDAVAITRNAFEESVSRHFVSDVPVGVFLSGGIDSTAMVSMARRLGYQQLHTYSIAFDEHEFNESEVALRTADYYGTKHHEFRIDADKALELFAEYLQQVDQPSTDGFNSFCISKFASSLGAKVVLSGVGGDEIFGGYPSFQRVPALVKWRSSLGWVFKAAVNLAGCCNPGFDGRIKLKLREFACSKGDIASAYWAQRGIFTPSEAADLTYKYTRTRVKRRDFGEILGGVEGSCLQDQVSYLELTKYLRNQLLHDSDVMSMAFGLELRVPLVDSTFMSSVLSIPTRWRLKAGKSLLVDAVGDMPDWVVGAKKRGFTFPFSEWLKTSDAWKSLFAENPDSRGADQWTWYQSWSILTLETAMRQWGMISS